MVGCSVQHCTTCLIVLHGPLGHGPASINWKVNATYIYIYIYIHKTFHSTLLLHFELSSPDKTDGHIVNCHHLGSLVFYHAVQQLVQSIGYTEMKESFRKSILSFKTLYIFVFESFPTYLKKNYLYLTNCIFQFQDSQGRVTI